jgi:ribosomal protein L11 methyltransferase
MLEQKLNLLKQSMDLTYQLAYHDIDEQDWAHSWKQYFFTEKITDAIVIKPSWRTYQAGPGEVVLEIDPGMAFGTGTHPTTRMCIALIEKYIRPGDRFLDVGTGSGILMIAAAKLGAAAMTGIDNDEMAVNVARQNLAGNHIPPEKYEIKTGNLVRNLTARYSLVAANILSEIIVGLADTVPEVMMPDSLFICSGIIESKQKMVRRFDVFFDKGNAHAGGGVGAGAEGHARIDFQNNIFRPGLISAPGRLDDNGIRYFLCKKILLPGVGPVLLINIMKGKPVYQVHGLLEQRQLLFQHPASLGQLSVFRKISDDRVFSIDGDVVFRPVNTGFRFRRFNDAPLQSEIVKNF